MSLQNSIKSQLTEAFNHARVLGSHKLAPRKGYFFIETVDYEQIPKKGIIPIATTLWKAQAKDAFIKDVHFKIAIPSLNLNDPLSYVTLSNSIIEITNAQIVESSTGGKPTMDYEYSLPDQTPVFTTLQDLVLAAFMGHEILTVSEAYQRFEKDLGIDLSDSINDEAQSEDIIEDVWEDTAEDPLDDFPFED